MANLYRGASRDEGVDLDRLRAMTPRPLYLHIGVGKSGTSAFQRYLWRAAEPLAAEGVGLPFVGRAEHVRNVLVPLGYRSALGFVEPLDAAALRPVADRIRQTPGERLMMSVEDLAEADASRVEALTEVLGTAEVDLHVIVTARHLGKQIPSEWQQFLKHRRTIDYPSFLEEVRTGQGEDGAYFWQRQHLPQICARWGSGLAPDHVHLLSVPPVSEDPSAIYRLFATVVGFDHEVLQPRLDVAVNESYGYLEAEMLRRVNVALGKRLRDYEREYMPAIRKVLVSRVIKRDASAKITVPPEHIDWVRETAEQWVKELHACGYDLQGDVARLVPPRESAAPLPPLDDAEMAARAVQTLTDFAVRIHQDSRKGAKGGKGTKHARVAKGDRDHEGGQPRPGLWQRLRRR